MEPQKVRCVKSPPYIYICVALMNHIIYIYTYTLTININVESPGICVAFWFRSLYVLLKPCLGTTITMFRDENHHQTTILWGYTLNFEAPKPLILLLLLQILTVNIIISSGKSASARRRNPKVNHQNSSNFTAINSGKKHFRTLLFIICVD